MTHLHTWYACMGMVQYNTTANTLRIRIYPGRSNLTNKAMCLPDGGDEERGLEWADGDRHLRRSVQRLGMGLPGGPGVADDGHPVPPGPRQRRRRVRRRAGPLRRFPQEVRQRRRRRRLLGDRRRHHLPLRLRVRHQQLKVINP
jgi:hypothetical protein